MNHHFSKGESKDQRTVDLVGILKGGEGIHECKNKPQVGHLAERVVRIRENRHIIHIKTSTV